MEIGAVIAWMLIGLVALLALLWLWDRVAPLVGILYGLFAAPVVQTVKDFKARYLLMPEDRPVDYVDEDNEEPALSPVAPLVAATPQNPRNVIAMSATDRNELLLVAKAEALAALVKAGKVGETEGIKIVYGLSPSGSNSRYTAARDALKQALADLEPRRYRTTPEEEAAIQDRRAELGLRN